ncbi:MAG: hypothetical protein RIR70_1423 [Pseudomonadota bacterium]|jgi:50S ribosomal protein L16 3-hydroxylase
MKRQLLGGLTPQQFLADYWQKKPLLVRGAFNDFKGPLTRDEVLSLACDDEAESRLIHHGEQSWQLDHGPFRRADFKRRTPWTVLVQGVNLFSDAADDLLHQFDFIPAARLDDLMVSYATDGGGVGPHFDSYDVFLLQGVGQRRWQVSNQQDLSLVPDAPLRILRDFQPTDEWVLNPGDMLYLPPHYAHNGVAVGECMTWSIGFRAPSAEEMVRGFFEFISEHLQLPGRYADPDLTLPRHRAGIDGAMLDKVTAMIESLRWRREDIADFLGCYLTEPKQHVFFDPPEKTMTRAAFKKKLANEGVRLHRKTQLLFAGHCFYLNGEKLEPSKEDCVKLQALADQRALPAGVAVSDDLMDLLREWWADGFVV